MAKKMTKQLEHLIDRFYKKLDAAQDARNDVMEYLQDHYDIDTNAYCETLSSEYDWCFGIDVSSIQELIEENNND